MAITASGRQQGGAERFYEVLSADGLRPQQPVNTTAADQTETERDGTGDTRQQDKRMLGLSVHLKFLIVINHIDVLS